MADDDFFNDDANSDTTADEQGGSAVDEEAEEGGSEFEIDIIVEDGSCVTGANCYVTLEEAVGHMQSMNRTDWLELSENEQKSSLIKAAQYIDRIFPWKGRRKYEAQEMAFPRVMLRDLDGYEVKGIPKRLKTAVIEAAWYSFQEELFTVEGGETGDVKKKRVEGAVEIEYFAKKDSDEDDGASKYKILNKLLRDFYIPRRARGFVNTKCIWTAI